jgi:hypothetical protein
MRTVGCKRTKRLEPDTGVATGDHHGAARQVEAGQNLFRG